MRTRVIVFLLLAALASMTLAACGGGNPAATPGGGGAPASDTPAQGVEEQPAGNEDPIIIKFAMWDAGEKITDAETDQMLGYIYDKLNIIIEPVNTTWDDYEEKIPVWAASGQMPDVSAIDAYGKPYYFTWIKEGIVKSLPADLSAWPSLQNMMAEYEGMKYDDGLWYTIPRPSFSDNNLSVMNKGVLLRKDWMVALGYDPDDQPKNYDDFVAMIKDMMANNPEQKGNVVGVTFSGYWDVMQLSVPWNSLLITGGTPWERDGDRWIQTGFLPKTRDAVTAIGQMWQEGILDRDLATIKEDEGVAKFASGRAAAYCYNYTPSALKAKVKDVFVNTYPDGVFEDMVTCWQPWNDAGGKPYYHMEPGYWSESYINADVDDAKFQRILDLYDFLLSEEGLRLYHYGLEGKDYDMVDGQPVSKRTEPLAVDYPLVDDWGWFASWDGDFMFTDTLAWGEDVIRMVDHQYAWWMNNARPDTEFQDFRNDFIVAPAAERFSWIIADDFVIAVTSDDPGAKWDEMLNNLMASGYQELIDQHNEIAASRGVTP